MPNATISKSKLLKLVGRELGSKELAEKLVYLGNTVDKEITGDEFEVESYVNRPDFLSEGGLSRALCGILGIQTGLRNYEIKKSSYKVVVNKNVEEIRPYVAFAVIKNMKMGENFVKSLMQLQEKLDITHCRKRRLAGMGTYDLDKLKFPIEYTTVSWNSRFVPLLYDKEMTIDQIFKQHPKGRDYGKIIGNPKEVPAYIDADKNLMCAIPVTQAQFGKVTEETRNMLIEVTGTDWNVIGEILNILTTNIADETNGDIYSVEVEYEFPTPMGKKITFPNLGPRKTIKLDPQYCNKLLGTEFKAEEMCKYLEKMRFGTKINGKVIDVQVPCYRTDILHPMDLVEDIAIAYGYNNFEPKIPNITTIGEEAKETVVERKIAELCCGLGMLECQTLHLSNENDLVKKMNLNSAEFIKTTNSINANYDVVRNSILASLIKILSENTHYEYPQNLFEVGEIYETLDEKMQLGMLLCDKDASYTKIRSCLESLFSGLGKEFKIKAKKDSRFIEGRCAALILDKKEIGIFGEINPQVLENFKIEMPVAGAEIYLEKLF